MATAAVGATLLRDVLKFAIARTRPPAEWMAVSATRLGTSVRPHHRIDGGLRFSGLSRGASSAGLRSKDPIVDHRSNDCLSCEDLARLPRVSLANRCDGSVPRKILANGVLAPKSRDETSANRTPIFIKLEVMSNWSGRFSGLYSLAGNLS